MRVLFTTRALAAESEPLVPCARLFEAAGHQVAFASFADFGATVEASGFRFFPVGAEGRSLLDVIAWCDDWGPHLVVTDPSLLTRS